MTPFRSLTMLCALAAMTACGGKASLPVEDRTRASPTLPAPQKSLLPVVNTSTTREISSSLCVAM